MRVPRVRVRACCASVPCVPCVLRERARARCVIVRAQACAAMRGDMVQAWCEVRGRGARKRRSPWWQTVVCQCRFAWRCAAWRARHDPARRARHQRRLGGAPARSSRADARHPPRGCTHGGFGTGDAPAARGNAHEPPRQKKVRGCKLTYENCADARAVPIWSGMHGWPPLGRGCTTGPAGMHHRPSTWRMQG